jgi:hypothetical protein
MSKEFSNKSTKNSMAVFPRLFCFIAVSGVSPRWEFKNTTKNVLQNKSCREVFTKSSTKNPKPIFFPLILLSRFWAFLGEESSKTPLKKYQKNESDPGPFLASAPPTHHGVTDFFFGGPLRPEG